MSTLFQDLRYASRSLLATPVVTLAAVLSLGLGIGANTTVFAWLQAVLLRPIPGAHDPDALYTVTLQTREGRDRSWSYPNFRDMRERATLAQFLAQDDLAMSIAVNGQAERAYGALVSGNYFQVLGVAPALGRLFSDADDRTPDAHPVVVISHAYWQRRFAGDRAIVGREVTVNNVPMTVIGVAPAGFAGSFLGLATSAFVPMAMQASMTGTSRLEARGSGWMNTLFRLEPGASQDAAQAEVSALLAQLAQEHPEVMNGWRAQVLPPWRASWGAPSVLAPILGILSVVVGLVLLIACANVANLLLARAVARRREIAVRLSLGAGRARLIRQLLTEALLLSSVAGGVGVVTAYATYGLLMAFAPPTDMPIDLGLRLDGTTLAYAVSLSLTTGVFFGMFPALQASRADTMHAIKEEGGRAASGGRLAQRFRTALAVAQVAVCLVLLVGAALFMRSLTAAQNLKPGFTTEGLHVASIDLVPNGYTANTGFQFHRRLTESAAAVPGATSVALARQVPLGIGGTSSMGAAIAGYVPRPGEEVNIVYNIVGPRYFETMQIPIVGGREFSERDTSERPKTLVVNETMAERYWPGGNALGGRVRLAGADHEVVGVARDIKYGQLNEPKQPYMYLALGQVFTSTVVVHVRSEASPEVVIGAVRDLVRAIDPNLPVFDTRTLAEHMRGAVFAQRIGANLLGAMGTLAIVLAVVGLYGVIAYTVSQRTQEMGIRLALGATPASVRSLVLRQGLKITSIGLLIGLALAFAAAQAIGSLLPGIAPTDPLTFIAVPLLLLSVSLIAAFIPARRASATDPVIALRYQ